MESRNFREMSRTKILVSEREGGLVSARLFKIHYEKLPEEEEGRGCGIEGKHMESRISRSVFISRSCNLQLCESLSVVQVTSSLRLSFFIEKIWITGLSVL